jgi:hypothetical protein
MHAPTDTLVHALPAAPKSMKTASVSVKSDTAASVAV